MSASGSVFASSVFDEGSGMMDAMSSMLVFASTAFWLVRFRRAYHGSALVKHDECESANETYLDPRLDILLSLVLLDLQLSPFRRICDGGCRTTIQRLVLLGDDLIQLQIANEGFQIPLLIRSASRAA